MNTTSNAIQQVVYASYVNLVALSLGVVFLVAGICTELPAEAAERSAMVNLEDLDLTTDGGMQVARGRLHEKARWLCNRVVEPWSFSHQTDFVRCVDDAVARAFNQLEVKLAANAKVRGELLSKR